MQIRSGLVLLGLAAFLSACSGSGGDMDFSSAALESDDQKASYGIGLNVGRQITETKDRLDRAAFMRGIEDALQGSEPALAATELDAVLSAFAADMEAAANAEYTQMAEENAASGAAYLAENGAKDGVTITESGLQYEVLRQGDGPQPGPDDQVRLHYRGTHVDGTEFDTSYGGDPAVFGVGGVIAGFSEALQLMPVGSHYRFVIPSDIAYGDAGSRGAIGPNETLIFEIELLEIVEN